MNRPEADPAFWAGFYQSNDTPWDLNQVAPPFKAFWESPQSDALPRRGTMGVLGSGAGHDAGYFGQQGFSVTGFDYTAEATQKATARYGQWARFVQADIFSLPPETDRTFDWVLEHTCFCAIPPERRIDYVTVVQRLLKPSGYLLGLFWAHSRAGGPPYQTDAAELTRLFSPAFEIVQLSATLDSVTARKGEELIGIFRRK